MERFESSEDSKEAPQSSKQPSLSKDTRNQVVEDKPTLYTAPSASQALDRNAHMPAFPAAPRALADPPVARPDHNAAAAVPQQAMGTMMRPEPSLHPDSPQSSFSVDYSVAGWSDAAGARPAQTRTPASFGLDDVIASYQQLQQPQRPAQSAFIPSAASAGLSPTGNNARADYFGGNRIGGASQQFTSSPQYSPPQYSQTSVQYSPPVGSHHSPPQQSSLQYSPPQYLPQQILPSRMGDGTTAKVGGAFAEGDMDERGSLPRDPSLDKIANAAAASTPAGAKKGQPERLYGLGITFKVGGWKWISALLGR